MAISVSWSNRLENAVGVILRSFGALFFASSSVSGLFFLLAIVAVNPQNGAMAIAGAAAACLTAAMLGGEKSLLEHGIYGFNGVLAGLGSTAFVRPEAVMGAPIAQNAWPLMLAIAAGALTGIIMRIYVRLSLHERPGLPALSLPSIIAVWAASRVFVESGCLTLSEDALFPPVVDLHWYGWAGVTGAIRLWIERGLPYSPVVVLFMIGYGLERPRRLFLALCAVALSLVVGGALIGPYAPIYPSYTFYCAPPMALALGWFFLVPSVRSVVTAIFAMVVAVFVWKKLGLWVERLELPLMTLPFALTSFAIQAVVRFAPRPLARILPQRVPLFRVGAADQPNLGPSRKHGLRYWKNIDDLAHTDEQDLPARSIRAALAHLTAAARPIAITGAGISTESGIPDYRSGIIQWNVYDPKELTFERFLADERARATYWRMSQDFYVLLREAKPNRAHRALAELEKAGKLKGIITQNVDRLHQRAGSTKVVEIHGNEFGVTCLSCGKRWSRDEIYRWVLHGTEVPYCLNCQGYLKPDSVAFGQPMRYDESRQALELADRADLLLVAGTSLSVEPLASLVARAAARGARLIIVNYGPTDFDAVADVLIRGSAGKVLERLAEEYRAQQYWVK